MIAVALAALSVLTSNPRVEQGSAPAPGTIDPLAADMALVARLATVAPPVSVGEMPLGAALETFSAQAKIPVSAQWKALAPLGITPSDPVRIDGAGASLLDALDTLAVGLGDGVEQPRFDIRGGTIILASEAVLKTLRQPRLISLGADAEPMYSMLLDHVDREGWVENGGSRQQAGVQDGMLVLTTTPRGHARIDQIIAQYRLANQHTVDFRLVVAEGPVGATLPTDGAPLSSLHAPTWNAIFEPRMTCELGTKAGFSTRSGILETSIDAEVRRSPGGVGLDCALEVRYAPKDGAESFSGFTMTLPAPGQTRYLSLPLAEGGVLAIGVEVAAP